MSLDALDARWKTFLGKVEARLGEILAEAGPGLDELNATEVLDPVPLASALTEVKARLQALSRKVDDSWSTIDAELDQLEDAGSRRDAMIRAGDVLRERIEAETEALELGKAADAARALYALAEAELDKPGGGRKCSSCGAPLAPTAFDRPSNVPCTHCKAVNTVRPGLATAMFFQGGGSHALAAEAAAEAGKALKAAEKRFQGLRHPAQEDALAFEAATAVYWRAYCEARGARTPGWTSARLDKEVKEKVGQAMHFLKRDAPAWQRMSRALALARAGDRRGLEAWLADEGADGSVSLDDVLEAAKERADKKALALLKTLAADD